MEFNKISDNRGNLSIIDSNKFDQILISHNDTKFTFRGMHYQENPQQVKIVKVVQGKIIDFVYNITTNKVNTYHLTPESEQLIVDKSMAHGYLTLEPNTCLLYTSPSPRD